MSIVVGGLPYAKLMSACTAEIDVSDKNTNAKLAEIHRQAAITAAQITKLCRLLRDVTEDYSIEPESLIVPIMATQRAHDKELARRNAYAIADAETAIRRLAAEARSAQIELASTRQNIGNAPLASFLQELAYLWIDITGTPPGKSKNQDGTPFDNFAKKILGTDDDISRQINTALGALDESVLQRVRKAGYLQGRWDSGEPG